MPSPKPITGKDCLRLKPIMIHLTGCGGSQVLVKLLALGYLNKTENFTKEEKGDDGERCVGKVNSSVCHPIKEIIIPR